MKTSGKLAMLATVCFYFLMFTASAKENARNYFQIKIYHLATDEQEKNLDNYLETAYLPAMHRAGIKTVGVFKPIQKDTGDKLVYVFVPFTSFQQFEQLDDKLLQDAAYMTVGKDYIDAVYNNAPYKRMESILLKAFTGMTGSAVPALTAPKSERVYELRSYESPTEKYYHNKVKMFNTGDEVGLFKRLGFNAVFYAEVLSGSHMPNLMYMTSFNSRQEREDHWKTFVDDAYWKTLSAKEEYQHNVSKADIFLLTPTSYSDF